MVKDATWVKTSSCGWSWRAMVLQHAKLRCWARWLRGVVSEVEAAEVEEVSVLVRKRSASSMKPSGTLVSQKGQG